MKTIIRNCMLLSLTLMLGFCTYAAEPTTIDELKAHYKEVAPTPKSLLADYTMTMNMSAIAPDTPEAQMMGDMSMEGTFTLLDDAMRMDLAMTMQMGEQSMDMHMDMLMDDAGMMHMLMDMGTMQQAMKMDMAVLKELAEELGVPESALGGNNMGMGFLQNPSKMLDVYEEMYTLELVGKETLNDEEVYLLTATMNEDILKTMEEHPLMAQQTGMFKFASKIYLGAQDGIMRKMAMGDFMTMTLSNIDLEAEITKDDLNLQIPEGVQVMDMTEMMRAMFAGDMETAEEIAEEIAEEQTTE